MNKGLTLLAGAGIGAGLAYLFDPQTGNRRRALARDQTHHLLNKTGDAVQAKTRDLQNRTLGIASEWASKLTREEVTDDILITRVRSRLGLVLSRPGSLTVEVDRGRVTVKGPILNNEVNRLLSAIRAVRGVLAVDDQLEVYSKADGIPGLQDDGDNGDSSGRIEPGWSPTGRLFGGAAGLALALYGARREGLLATAVGTFGLGLLVRGVTNMPMNQLAGIGPGRRAVDIQRSVEIAAPVEQVYAFWNNHENFPRFMTNVREVRKLDGGRSRWVVAGPMGVWIEWEAAITEQRENEALAWKSVPGSIIDHAGEVYFNPGPQGGTQIDLRMAYNPPGGAVGHIAAVLFGSDPNTQMDEDLIRMKRLIESGNPPDQAAA